MIVASLAGLAAGVIHAIVGPDHVLGLAPLAVGNQRAWRLGCLWGLGHGVGSLFCAAILLAFVSTTDLGGLDRWAHAAAGAALVWMGLLGLRRHLAPSEGASPAGGGSAFAVGLVHGVTGASAIVLLLPAVIDPGVGTTGGYLLGFALGGVAAMTAITALLARLGASRPGASRWMGGMARLASTGSVLLGGFWFASALA